MPEPTTKTEYRVLGSSTLPRAYRGVLDWTLAKGGLELAMLRGVSGARIQTRTVTVTESHWVDVEQGGSDG